MKRSISIKCSVYVYIKVVIIIIHVQLGCCNSASASGQEFGGEETTALSSSLLFAFLLLVEIGHPLPWRHFFMLSPDNLELHRHHTSLVLVLISPGRQRRIARPHHRQALLSEVAVAKIGPCEPLPSGNRHV